MSGENTQAPKEREVETDNLIVETSDVPEPQPESAPEPEKRATEEDQEQGDDDISEADGDDQGDSEDGQDDDSDADKKPEPTDDDKSFSELPKGVRKRLARSQRRAQEAQDAVDRVSQENEALKKRLDALEGKGDTKPKAALTADDFDDFDTYLSYRDADDKDAWLKENRPEDAPAPSKNNDAKADNLGDRLGGIEPDRFFSAKNDLAEKVSTDDPDLWDRVSDPNRDDYVDLEISAPLVLALSETDAPAELIKHFVENPKEAAKFSKMDQFGQARALAKVEASFTNSSRDPGDDQADADDPRPAPKGKRLSKTEPIDEVKGRGSAPKLSYSDMTQREFEEAREREEKSSSKFGRW